MIIVDNALKARAEQGKPIKVAILGGGFMAQGLTYQIVNSVPAMSMVAIYSRKPQKAIHVLNYSGLENPIEATTQRQLDDAISDGKPVFTQDVMLLARAISPLPGRKPGWNSESIFDHDMRGTSP